MQKDFVFLGAGQTLTSAKSWLEPEFALLTLHFDPHDEEVEEIVGSLFGRLACWRRTLTSTRPRSAWPLSSTTPVPWSSCCPHRLVHHELLKNKDLLEKLRGQLFTDNRYALPQ